MIQLRQLQVLVGGDGFGNEEIALLKTQPDNELVDLIHQLRVGSSSEILNAKRDYVIALLDSRGGEKMLRLTWWIATLTWVLVGVGVLQVVDIIVRYLR